MELLEGIKNSDGARILKNIFKRSSVNDTNNKLKIRIREARIEDIPAIVAVEKKAWPKDLHGTEKVFESRITTFPEGTLVAETNNKIMGVVSTQIIRYDHKHPIVSWHQATDDGHIKKTHNPKGNAIYGVDLSVDPQLQNRGLAKKLLMQIGRLAIKYNIQYGILGGRIPGYHKFAAEMSAEEYLNKKTETGEPFDPEFRFYLNSKLKLIKLIPNYFKDYESCNYGILLLWKNPFYTKYDKVGKLLGKFLNYLFRL